MLAFELAWRFAFNRSKGQLAAFLTRISGIGLLLSVALLVCVLTVMQGFEKEMKERILNLVPQLVVSSTEGIDDWQALASSLKSKHKQIIAAAPLIQQQGLIKHGAAVESALIYGLDAELEAQVSDVSQFIPAEQWRQWQTHKQGGLLGSGLAKKLQLSVGDSLVLIVPKSEGGRLQQPVLKRFHVTAIIETGTELDQNLFILPMEQARSLSALKPGSVHGIKFKLDDIFAAIDLRYLLQSELGFDLVVRSWAQTHGNLFQAIRLSKQLVAMILFAIIAVAGFNVISSLVLIVKDRQSDIAILRSIGLSSKKVVLCFMVMGLYIASFATFFGVILGVILAYSAGYLLAAVEWLLGFRLLNTEVYPVNYLPASLYWPDILLVVLASLLAGLVATFYPAWRAGRLKPAIVLRHD